MIERLPRSRIDFALEVITRDLGVHLIQKMVDSLQYRYQDRQSRITFSKEYQKEDV